MENFAGAQSNLVQRIPSKHWIKIPKSTSCECNSMHCANAVHINHILWRITFYRKPRVSVAEAVSHKPSGALCLRPKWEILRESSRNWFSARRDREANHELMIKIWIAFFAWLWRYIILRFAARVLLKIFEIFSARSWLALRNSFARDQPRHGALLFDMASETYDDDELDTDNFNWLRREFRGESTCVPATGVLQVSLL